MIRRIYVKLQITMLHTKYRNFGSCSFREEDFYMYSHYKTMADDDAPRVGPVWIPAPEDHYTLLHTKYESSGSCGFGEEDFFYVFPIVSLWELSTPRVGPFLTPGAWLAGLIKSTTTHCYIQNMKALGLLVSEKKIFFMFFP